MKRTAMLLFVVAVLVGSMSISFAQDTAEDEFPVDLYLDFQGVIVSIDEEAGTFTLDNGVQVTMDFTALPPDISVAVGDIVTVSGALQEDGSILADIIIESPDTSSPETDTTTQASDGDGDTETGGVVFGPGGSACDQADNCELVENPGNEGTLEVPEGADTVVFKAGLNYVEIEIPEDGEEVCVDGYCIVSDEDGNLSFYVEDGAQDISHIQLWDVEDDTDATPEPTEPPADVTPEPTEPPTDTTPEPTEPPMDVTPEPTEPPTDVTPEPTEPPDDVTCGYGVEGEGTSDSDNGCHPVLVVFSEAFETPYEELDALFTEENYGIGEIGRTYLLAQEAGVPVSDITAMRDEGMGWGQIMQEYPDVHPSQLAPGSVIGNGRGHSVRNGGEGGPPDGVGGGPPDGVGGGPPDGVGGGPPDGVGGGPPDGVGGGPPDGVGGGPPDGVGGGPPGRGN